MPWSMTRDGTPISTAGSSLEPRRARLAKARGEAQLRHGESPGTFATRNSLHLKSKMKINRLLLRFVILLTMKRFADGVGERGRTREKKHEKCIID